MTNGSCNAAGAKGLDQTVAWRFNRHATGGMCERHKTIRHIQATSDGCIRRVKANGGGAGGTSNRWATSEKTLMKPLAPRKS